MASFLLSLIVTVALDYLESISHELSSLDDLIGLSLDVDLKSCKSGSKTNILSASSDGKSELGIRYDDLSLSLLAAILICSDLRINSENLGRLKSLTDKEGGICIPVFSPPSSFMIS